MVTKIQSMVNKNGQTVKNSQIQAKAEAEKVKTFQKADFTLKNFLDKK